MELSLMNLCWILLLSLCVIFVVSNPEYYASEVGLGNHVDKDALINLKSQVTEDPLEVLYSRNDSLHFCQWSGVKFSANHQRVISLALKHHNLAATISPRPCWKSSFLGILDIAEILFMVLSLRSLVFWPTCKLLTWVINILQEEIPIFVQLY